MSLRRWLEADADPGAAEASPAVTLSRASGWARRAAPSRASGTDDMPQDHTVARTVDLPAIVVVGAAEAARQYPHAPGSTPQADALPVWVANYPPAHRRGQSDGSEG